MKNETKSQEVLRYFERFAELCPDIPTDEFQVWEDTPRDPPDISVGDGKLGIEVVRFVHGAKSDGGSEQRAGENVYNRLIREAEAQFKQKCNLVLGVHPLWSNDQPPKNSQKQEIIEALLDVITSHIPQYTNELVELKDFRGTCLEQYLISLAISKQPSDSYPTWANSWSGPIFFGIKDIERIIQDKEKDLKRYKPKFKSVWLLIVASGKPISSYAAPDKTVEPGCIQSKFNQVYFLNMDNSPQDKPLICLTGENN